MKNNHEMKVPMGDGYILHGDNYCYWITLKRVAEESGVGREERVSGYSETLEDTFLSFARRNKDSDITSWTKWVESERKLKKEIKKMVGDLDEVLRTSRE